MIILTMNSGKTVQKHYWKLPQNYWKMFRHHNTESTGSCIWNICEEYLYDWETFPDRTILLNTLQNKRKFNKYFFLIIF